MLTLKKVKEMVKAPVHTKRVPSPKVLLEDGRILLRKEFEHGAPLFPGTVRLSQSAAPLEAGLCPQDAGGRMAPAFRGSLAEASPCGISAGCAAVLRHRGTGCPDCQLRKGSEEP